MLNTYPRENRIGGGEVLQEARALREKTEFLALGVKQGASRDSWKRQWQLAYRIRAGAAEWKKPGSGNPPPGLCRFENEGEV
jgi:hypothetical protein